VNQYAATHHNYEGHLSIFDTALRIIIIAMLPLSYITSTLQLIIQQTIKQFLDGADVALSVCSFYDLSQIVSKITATRLGSGHGIYIKTCSF
jgi:hypothetical protein